MKQIKASAKTRLEVATPQEGDFSHKVVIDSQGMLGLDGSEHTNDGYRLKRVPMRIYRTLAEIQVQRKIASAMFYSGEDYWAFKFAKDVNVDLRFDDLRSAMKAGLVGFRKDFDGEFLLYFKE